MQKKLIALAVAGLVSVPAFAQSNVTIYGRMDAGLFNQDEIGTDGKEHAVTRVDSSGWTTSRLGFKGAESLGNGLQALFQVETTLVNDDATGLTGTGRDTFVGLGGGFGAVLLGRLSSPVNSWLADFDHAEGSPKFKVTNVSGSNIFETRADNTIAYATPNMGGFQAIAYYSFNLAANEVGPSSSEIRVGGVGFRYTAGGLDAFYSYNNADHLNNLVGTTANLDLDNHSVGLSYDFGVAKIMGAYLHTGGDFYANNAKQYSLGVQVPVGAGVISAGFGHDQNIGGVRDNDQDTWSLTYKHNLSKRTFLYAGYQRQDPDGGIAQDTYGVGVAHHF